MKPNQPDSIGTVLKDLQRRMKIAETSPQLTKASIKDGALRVLDADFEERVKIGRLDADLDGDGDDDWGIVIFDEDGEWALLGTKLGVFVRGALAGGTIDIGGDDATSFHVDADGNMWVGAALFSAAPFKVDAAGNVTVGDTATITGATVRTDDSGLRIEITGVTGDRIVFYTGNVNEDLPGSLAVGSAGQLNLFAPSIGGVDGGSLTLEPGLAVLSADEVGFFGTRVFTSCNLLELDADAVEVSAVDGLDLIGSTQLLLDGNPAWRGGVTGGATNAAGDFTIPHGLGAQPLGVSVNIDAGGATFLPYTATVQFVDPTNITVRVFDSTTGNVVGAGVSLNYWWTALGG